jgi:hypothetical protein
MRVKEMASDQEQTEIELPTTVKTSTKDGTAADAADLPTFSGHLFADENGLFPAKFNSWERIVIDTETGRTSFVGWYRNPSRAGTSALRIGYLDDADIWQSLQVDFVIVSKRADGSFAAAIVDPHGAHLADAVPKLKAVAGYAERFGQHFARVASIAEGSDGVLRVLDLLDAKVCKVVLAHRGPTATALYDDAAISRPFK